MLFVYKITRDYGFAPNPFWGYCTLATCKPNIRERCLEGDAIAGFSSNKKDEQCKLICFMKVTESMSFDEYWGDARFQKKKPVFAQQIQEYYGDNIYHHDDKGVWIQENSHHSREGGAVNTKNLLHDTRINRVLISEKYWYFGENAIILPVEFKDLIPYWRDYKKFDVATEKKLEDFLEKNYQVGIGGKPARWINSEFERYGGN